MLEYVNNATTKRVHST